jgi:hypothetical protein
MLELFHLHLLGQQHHIPSWIPAAFHVLLEQIDEFITPYVYQELGMLNVHVHYLHPESPSQPATVLRKLELAAIPKVNWECQRLTVESMTEQGVLMMEERMILEGGAKLKPINN